MSRPCLSLCMIVRDSSRTLGACLASIRPWVAEIIVVDTGSVDDTRQIAEAFGAQVHDFPWIDDFSAARNESLRLANGQWLFWMDSDDSIAPDNGQKLRELVAGNHPDDVLGYVMQVHCPSGGDIEAGVTVVDHVKLFRRHPEIQFEGRIHEQVLPSIRRLGGQVAWSDLFVTHSGADQTPEGKARKIERDLRILKLDVQERPDHPFVLFNLGMTYEDIGHYAQAEDWLRKCLAASRPEESHVRKAYALLASCQEHQGRPNEARETCCKGLKLFPDDEELLFRRGNLDHRASDLAAAEQAYRTILERRTPRHFTSIDRGLLSHKTRHNLALVLESRGAEALAEIQWRQAYLEVPAFEPTRQGLTSLLHRQGKQTALVVLREEAAALGSSRSATPSPMPVLHEAKSGDARLETEPSMRSRHQAEANDWPPCHSRRLENAPRPDACLCAHPHMAARENVVSKGICNVCQLRLEPPPASFRDCPPPRGSVHGGPCAHLGREIGLMLCATCGGNVRLKVFACGHANHESTTLAECRQCSDFVPKDR